MILTATGRQSNCTAGACWLKLAIALFPLLASGWAIPQERTADAELRQELVQLLESGQTERAVARVQTALRRAPDDAAVRREYVALHLTLARDWLAQRRFNDCLTAVQALLTVEPDHDTALAIQRQVLAAQAKATSQMPEIDRLLRLELFDSALGQIQEVRALQPDLAGTLTSREHAAWRGVADDHYLAGNSVEAFALYEHVLSTAAEPPADATRRWLISLALALSDSSVRQPIQGDVADRILSRVTEAIARTQEPWVGGVIAGLLAEREGRHLDAGREYSRLLETPWEPPPADKQRPAVARLHQQALQRVRAAYAASRVRRRAGAWRIVLPEVWKHRKTEHFDISARNDLVAERIAEAAEFHFAGLSAWLGLEPDRVWEPRCVLRVHATLDELHEATGSEKATRAVTQMRRQDKRVLLRQVDLYQADPWLLASTLPHELTPLLVADACPEGELPLAIDAGLALQAEPPARRLQLRRQLESPPPSPTDVLTARRVPGGDPPSFHANCDALLSLLLHRGGIIESDRPNASPIAIVLHAFRAGYTPQWWKELGWQDEQALLRDWAAWHEARREPPRMPIMILAQPPQRDPGNGTYRHLEAE